MGERRESEREGKRETAIKEACQACDRPPFPPRKPALATMVASSMRMKPAATTSSAEVMALKVASGIRKKPAAMVTAPKVVTSIGKKPATARPAIAVTASKVAIGVRKKPAIAVLAVAVKSAASIKKKPAAMAMVSMTSTGRTSVEPQEAERAFLGVPIHFAGNFGVVEAELFDLSTKGLDTYSMLERLAAQLRGDRVYHFIVKGDEIVAARMQRKLSGPESQMLRRQAFMSD